MNSNPGSPRIRRNSYLTDYSPSGSPILHRPSNTPDVPSPRSPHLLQQRRVPSPLPPPTHRSPYQQRHVPSPDPLSQRSPLQQHRVPSPGLPGLPGLPFQQRTAVPSPLSSPYQQRKIPSPVPPPHYTSPMLPFLSTLIPSSPSLNNQRPLTPISQTNSANISQRPPTPLSSVVSSHRTVTTRRPPSAGGSLPRSPALSPRNQQRRQNILEIQIQNPPPLDRRFFVYCVVILHGMTVFAPWNMYATVYQNYFLNHKLSASYVNATLTSAGELKMWQNTYAIKMAMTTFGLHLLLSILNCLIQVGHGRLGFRITVSMMVMIVCFLVNTFVTVTETGVAFHFFIYLSLSVLALLSAALGVYHSSMWGVVSQLPQHYCNAFLMGNNVFGLICSLFIIIVTAANADVKITSVIFFLIGTILILVTVCTYFFLTINNFFMYYVQTIEIAEPKAIDWSGFGVFKSRWQNFLDIFVTYFVTYLIYPNVAMWIDLNQFTGIDERLSSQVYCFLTFNIFAFAGNVIANFVQQPKQRFLWILTHSRLGFVPFFMLLNYVKPDRMRRFTSLVITPGVIFWFSTMALGITHGYASSLAMIYPTRFGVKASIMSVIFLVLGMALGLAASLLFDKILLI